MNNLINRIAKKSTHKTYKHVSIVVKGGAIQSVGYNHDDFHSEFMAVNKIWPNKRAGTSIINVRVTKTGFANARPCDKCMDFLRFSGVRKVTFTNNKGNWITERI